MAKQTSLTKQSVYSGRTMALALATMLLAGNFWAWSLISPLATQYGTQLNLEPLYISILVAVPVIVGSLGRIILGALTDRYGGRRMFISVTVAVVLPVLFLAGANEYSELVGGALLLGLAGATFAIGVPYVNAWYPPSQRGLALGVFGMGNLGVSVSGFLTPRIATHFGRPLAFYAVVCALVILVLVASIFMRNSPSWRPNKKPMYKQLRAAAKRRNTWDFSLLYMLTFGAFVALGVYLPTLLRNDYKLTVMDAATKAAGFVLLATLARPLGGWLSDRIGGQNVIRTALLLTAALAIVLSQQTSLTFVTTACFLGIAFCLGCGNGAIFALVGRNTPSQIVGNVTGIIGAVGGLGGFFPPLLLGLVYQATHSYRIAIILLAITAVLILVYINTRLKYLTSKAA